MGQSASKAVWGAAIALSMLIPGTAVRAASGPGKLDKLLKDSARSGSPQQVIIRTRAGAKAAVKNKLSRRGNGPKEHRLIDALSARLSADEIAALSNDADVLSVSADADVIADAATTTSATTTTSTDYTSIVSDVKKAIGLANWVTPSP
jgi:hypothetical protein